MAAGGLTGILLVGGASRRFGSPKALALFEGETLAERAWRTLGKACDERIAVGKAADSTTLPFPVLADGIDVEAAIAGLIGGLRIARTERVVAVPVDTPLVRAEDLTALAGAGAQVCIPQTGPLPCALRRSALTELERSLAAGRLSLRDAFSRLDVRVVQIDPQRLANVNTPASLRALELTIVPFRSEHEAGFRSLVADTLREFGFEPDPELDPDLGDPAAEYAAVWVALADGEVVGSIALRDLGQGKLELKRMYVRPRSRGRGLGRRLLGEALEWAQTRGARAIKLDTTEEMEAARRLYEQSGFVRVPGDAPRQGQQRLLYELRL